MYRVFNALHRDSDAWHFLEGHKSRYNNGVSKIIDKTWFKWVVISASLVSILSLFGFFMARDYLRKREREEMAAEARRTRIEYEDKFRTTMTRIYQNLKLDHFLAAYNNLEFLESPALADREMAQEYIDVLYRIGRGLLDAGFLKESEAVFSTIRTYEGQVSPANSALSEIDSKRRASMARIRIEAAEKLLQESRYRDAFAEFQKADLELQSVKLMGFETVDQDLERLYEGYRRSKYHVALMDAEKAIVEAEAMLQHRNFAKIRGIMAKASELLALAAHYQRGTPQAAKLRERLVAIDSEMSVIIPNEQPIWNIFKPEDATQYSGYFFLDQVDISSRIDEKGLVQISLAYYRRANDKNFVLRYRIYFQDGTSVFNGHFLAPDGQTDSDSLQRVTFLQELPERFRQRRIRRVEVNVYNEDNTILSRVSRAFRTES